MRKASKTLLTATFASTILVMSAWAGETLDRIKSTGMLTVATNSDYRPNAFLNDQNELDGFDIAVAKEVASRIGVDVKFVTPGWEVMTAGRWSGRWDMVVGSMTPTSKRSEVLDFPSIYYFSPAVFAVHKTADYNEVSDLNGKTVGVVSSSTYHQYLEQNLAVDAEGMPEFTYQVAPSEIKLYQDVNEFDDLALGDGARLHAVLQSLSVVHEATQNLPVKQLGGPVFYEPLAIATDKGDQEFNDLIAETIEAMRDDGTLAGLSEKWHGVDLVTVK